MSNVLGHMLERSIKPTIAPLRQRGIERIVLEDSSIHRLPKVNVQTFPAHGNAHGSTAGVKCDLVCDLLSGQPIHYSIERATEQDRTIGKEILIHLKPKDIVLRDMGYFDLSEFAFIEREMAFWLSRLPLTTHLTVLESNKNTEGYPLADFLRKQKGNTVDQPCLAGEISHRCRLIAIRAENSVAQKRRRERKDQARKMGKTPSQEALIRDGWHLMLTNLDVKQADTVELAALYRGRWAIEIQFRAWKQSGCLAKALNRRSNSDHIECLIYAAMINHLAGLKLGLIYASDLLVGKLSYERLYDTFSQWVMTCKTLWETNQFTPDSRHIKRDLRAAPSPIEQAIGLLD